MMKVRTDHVSIAGRGQLVVRVALAAGAIGAVLGSVDPAAAATAGMTGQATEVSAPLQGMMSLAPDTVSAATGTNDAFGVVDAILGSGTAVDRARPGRPCATRIDSRDGSCALEQTRGAQVASLKPITTTEASSGLPWRSGAACGGAFASWRHRGLDIATNWAPYTSWGSFENFFQHSAGYAERLGATASIGLPMLTSQTRGQFSQCASGQFDTYYRNAASRLAAAGAGNAVIRIGWEANANWTPWSIGHQAAAYKACFTRIAGIFRGVSHGFKIEWPMIKKGQVNPVTQAYPGDGAVDYIGISYYDRDPVNASQTVWDQQVNATRGGSPTGIGAWLRLARAHGKKLAVPEWAVSNGYRQAKGPAGFDNPVYVQNMMNFFRRNAGSIAYESYFNCQRGGPKTYLIYPTQYNPRASSAYLAGLR